MPQEASLRESGDSGGVAIPCGALKKENNKKLVLIKNKSVNALL